MNLILVDGATLTAGQGIRVAVGDSLAIWCQSGHSGELVAVNSGGAAIGDGLGDNDAGRLAIDGMRAYAGETAVAPVEAALREGVCRSEWTRLVPCAEHDYDTQGVCLFCGLGVSPVPYRDPTDADAPDKVCGEYANFIEQTELSNGWYVTRGEVQAAGRVEVAGDVHLLLCDGAALTATQGLHVTGTNRLTVWAQSADPATAGKLTVAGVSTKSAGIGGNNREEGGIVTVNGGVLTISGGQYGAGIGGGGSAGGGGNITINGGTVKATGNEHGAGIGGGGHGDGGTIAIDGGEVTAIGGKYGAGIGGGYTAAGGTITIDGGTVTATAGVDDAQAIGHGRGNGDAGTLAIDGMRVFASAEAAEPVASEARVDTCRSGWAKVEVCPHNGDSGSCPWCGLVFAYAAWAADNGIAGAWNAKDADGIANVFRYLFGQPTGDFEDPPMLSIEVEDGGQLVARTPPVVYTNGFDCVLSAADDPGWTDPTLHSLDPTGETDLPGEPPEDSRTRFFRLKAVPNE